MSSISSYFTVAGAVAAAISFAVPANSQTIPPCATGGAGVALFPTTGTGGTGAVYQTTFPTAGNFSSTLACTPPVGSTCVTSITLHGLTHTWTSDVQIVLDDPAGNRHNIWCRDLGSCDFGGDYVFIESGGSAYPACTGAQVLPSGTYNQDFGPVGVTWLGGNGGSGANVSNTPMYSIPALAGNYKLTFYDWVGGDTGSLASWDICFGVPPPPPPPPAPILSAPANASVVSNPVALSWNPSAGATFYNVDIDGTVFTPIAGTTYPAATYAPGVHTWKVSGENGVGAGPYSTPWTFTIPAPPPPSVCVSGGAGGFLPTAGSGDGTWPTAMPTAPLDAPLAVTVPPGSTKIVRVKLNTLSHTYIGDTHFVLEDPTGLKFNILHRPGFTGAGFGAFCDWGGDYSIYEASGAAIDTTCPAATVAPGDYIQDFGTGGGLWPSGTNGIVNTLMSAIPISSGVWVLHMYDWAGGDTGSIASWELCFDVQSAPVAYCTSGTSSNGCVPAISANNQPSVAMANSCNITIANLEGQKFGIIFYGINNTGFSPAQWAVGSNSFLCVKGPTQRTGSSSSGGTINLCDGALTLDWNAYQTANPTAVGNPWAAGNKVYVQGWYRDPPAPKTTNLSGALEMTYAP